MATEIIKKFAFFPKRITFWNPDKEPKYETRWIWLKKYTIIRFEEVTFYEDWKDSGKEKSTD
jgi:hypothetical protein